MQWLLFTGSTTTNTVEVTRALWQVAQCCLWMIFVSGMEERLSNNGLAFDPCYMEEGVMQLRRLLNLFFADDIMLLADNVDMLQSILDICSEEGLCSLECCKVGKHALHSEGAANRGHVCSADFAVAGRQPRMAEVILIPRS